MTEQPEALGIRERRPRLAVGRPMAVPHYAEGVG